MMGYLSVEITPQAILFCDLIGQCNVKVVFVRQNVFGHASNKHAIDVMYNMTLTKLFHQWDLGFIIWLGLLCNKECEDLIILIIQ